jgi:hypothetical protein
MNIPQVKSLRVPLSVIQTSAVKMMHTADRQLHHAAKLLPGSFVQQPTEIARKKDEKSGRRLQGPL